MSHKNIHLLLNDYAGEVSELTAITQYLHHHFVVGYKDVAKLLEEISLVEMRHFEMLGEALRDAGIDPRIYNTHKKYWTGNYVNYQYNVCDILRADIVAELDAISQYYRHIALIPNRDIQTLLRRIIKDELKHIELFSEKLAQHCRDFDYRTWLKQSINNYNLELSEREHVLSTLRLS
ncbi:MAG TPA: bacterioferritin [Firmicutes bacterium]|jgi:bacterioferritin|nr:bacterioferritin [Bacillota bacterium]HAA38332.1 bacterioferritin [Bacillota bacterium]